MRKILIFTTCFILLLSSFVFASSGSFPLKPINKPYYSILRVPASGNVYLVLCDYEPSRMGTGYAYVNLTRYLLVGDSWEFFDHHSSGIFESNITIHGNFGGLSPANFLQPPLIQGAMKEFLPSLMSPVGGTVSVALVMFGMLLVATLVPRLIRRLAS